MLAVTSLIAPAQVKEPCDTIMSHDLEEITVKAPKASKPEPKQSICRRRN